MHISITARKFTLNDDLREYVEKEVSHLDRFYDGVIDADVVLGWEKRTRFVEITLKVNGVVLVAHDRSERMEKSIDSVVEKLERQLKKYKEKKHEYNHEKILEKTILEAGEEE